MTRSVQWCRYDLLDYQAALLLQKERVADILRPVHVAHATQTQGTPEQPGETTSLDQLILLEHPSVYTIGRSGHRRDIFIHTDLSRPPIPVVETDRGGQVTYHGPGQLVIYLIRDLRPHALASVRNHVNRLEESAIQALSFFGVAAHRDPQHPGVWVGHAKIGALGVRICRGVAYHGIAINRDLDLQPFCGIVPCGLTDRSVTSLADLGVLVSRSALEAAFLHAFATVFNIHHFFPPLPAYSGRG